MAKVARTKSVRTLESNQHRRAKAAKVGSNHTKMASAGVDWPDAPHSRLELSDEEHYPSPAVAGVDLRVRPVGRAQCRRGAHSKRRPDSAPNHGGPRQGDP